MNNITEQLSTMYAGDGTFDPSPLMDRLAPDVVLHVPGEHPLAGDHHGPAGVGSFLQRNRAITDDGEHIELIDVLTGDHHIGAYVRVTADRGGKQPLDNHTIHLFRIDQDRIAEIWFHNREQAPVDAFWS